MAGEVAPQAMSTRLEEVNPSLEDIEKVLADSCTANNCYSISSLDVHDNRFNICSGFNRPHNFIRNLDSFGLDNPLGDFLTGSKGSGLAKFCSSATWANLGWRHGIACFPKPKSAAENQTWIHSSSNRRACRKNIAFMAWWNALPVGNERQTITKSKCFNGH